MGKTVDARGLPCPQPVILTRNAMQEAVAAGRIALTTIVDNETAAHNVTRMAERHGASVSSDCREDGVYLRISGGQASQQEESSSEARTTGGRPVLVVSSESMGRGEHEELGRVLIRGFFHTLGEVHPSPETIIFVNSGVRLVVTGSPILEDLQALSERGAGILACGTCLGYYGLKEQIAVGEVSNMYTIAETMLSADKVVSL